jgi:formylglycine-generating enzyme required for sulfatase activity
MHRLRLSALGLVLALAAVAHAANLRTDTLDLGNGVTLDLVELKAGTFTMGSPAAEKGRRKDEDAVSVKIDHDFAISRFPITRGQFKAFTNETRYKTEAEDGKSGGFGWDGSKLTQKKEYTWKNPGFPQTDEHPVVMITLKDAKAFCHWMQKKANRKITLPTEAQWEFACRAGATTRFYSGDNDADADDIAWTRNNSDHATHPVGQKKPNDWGLCDMSGNVYQWCLDVYGPYRKGGPVEGELDKERNVLRGGSWLKGINDARSAARYRNTPGSRNADNGFRIVAEIKPPPAVESTGRTENTPVIDLPPANPVRITPVLPAPPPVPFPPPAAPTFTPRSNFPAFFSCAFFAVIAGILIAILIAVVRAIRGSAPPQLPSAVPPPIPPIPPIPPQNPPRIRPRVADDGFFIDTSAYNPGDVLVYSYDTPDGQVVQQYTVDQPIPGQFIYTGVRPANLAFQALGAAAVIAAQRRHYQQQQYTPPPPPPPPRQERTFGGFPSAY